MKKICTQISTGYAYSLLDASESVIAQVFDTINREEPLPDWIFDKNIPEEEGNVGISGSYPEVPEGGDDGIH